MNFAGKIHDNFVISRDIFKWTSKRFRSKFLYENFKLTINNNFDTKMSNQTPNLDLTKKKIHEKSQF